MITLPNIRSKPYNRFIYYLNENFQIYRDGEILKFTLGKQILSEIFFPVSHMYYECSEKDDKILLCCGGKNLMVLNRKKGETVLHHLNEELLGKGREEMLKIADPLLLYGMDVSSFKGNYAGIGKTTVYAPPKEEVE